MKAQRQDPVFKPVSLILETQEEVDKLYAILNNGPITEALDLPNDYECLKPFATDSWPSYHAKLVDLLLR